MEPHYSRKVDESRLIALEKLRAEAWKLALMAEDEAELVQRLLDTAGPVLGCESIAYMPYGQCRDNVVVQQQWRADGQGIGLGEIVPGWIFTRYLGQPYVQLSFDQAPSWLKPALKPFEQKYSPRSSLVIPYGNPHRPEGYIALNHNTSSKTYSIEEVGVCIDLADIIRLRSSQLRTQAALQEQQERLELALLGTDLGVWDWDVQTGKMLFNQRWVEMLGYTPAEIEPHVRSWQHRIHPDDAPTVQSLLANHLQGCAPTYQTEHRLRSKSGQWKWVLDTGNVVARDAQGNPVRMAGTHQDITNRKEAEGLLQLQRDLILALGATSDSSEAFKQVLAAAFQIEGIDCGGGYLVDTRTGALSLIAHEGLSPQFVANATYYPADAPETKLIMAGQPVYKSYNAVAQPDEEKHQEGLRALAVIPVLHNGQVIAALNLSSHTQDVIAPNTRYALEVIAAQIGVVIARIKAEVARQESLQNLQTLFDTVSDFLFILDAGGDIVNINPAVQQRLGYSAEELLGMNVLAIHPPERREEAGNIVAAMLAGERSFCPVPLITKAGQLIPVETKVVKGQWSGQPGLFGLSRDITERLQSEAVLLEREQLLHALFSQALDGFFFMMLDAPVRWDDTVDKDAVLDYAFHHQRITRINAAILEQYRATEEQLIGKTPGGFFAHDSAQGREIWRRLFDEGRLHIETNGCKFDGTQMWVEGDYVCLYDSDGRITGHFGIQRDVTQRRQAAAALQESYRRLETTLAELQATQQQLLQQERLAAVGQIAAGIAHDFNNILTCILSYTELLQMSPETPEALQSDLETIKESSQRAAHLVRQLLDFSRKTIRHLRQLKLDTFARETVSFLARVIPEHIQITLTVAPGDYLIEADPTQMQQVITNLAVNARDAMPNGGELRIGLARIVCQGDTCCSVCHQPITGEWVQLNITDTGSGIPADILPRIFEPFFTTKDVGKGVGLGLSQVYGIMKQQRGHTSVESQVGKGTTFTVYLPPSAAKEIPATTEPTHITKGQGETILLVEDEPSVLAVTTAMLQQLGYQVRVASNGLEAVSLLDVYHDDVALVLSDMVMPDMDGAALFRHLKVKTPQIKMIIMSGYPLGETGVSLLQQGVVAWFEKPIPFGQLSATVSRVLSGRKGRWG
ncbi:PAS domain S-box protein [Oscillochloris sp. ZM17-4]|uniref:PAS domain S-box protein n=1 Tax=Oscillochloris sp. ZM17-4 TaxID=2866714 RepID=UPI001C73B431|nr:PAS domain S-box protein [Oscillochloris sp. ZM17-4]MBX0329195.1 PAS domain S-box protein [Oscillochloris sp. ZM17-4]